MPIGIADVVKAFSQNSTIRSSLVGKMIRIASWFVDLAHIGRYADMIPAWEITIRQSISHRHESSRHIAVW
ncbi:MAG: hypothetical protein JNL77_05035 [Nitrosomonas sp.]|nr:hypothetical protein [Nitrosomonas sp.]